MRKIAALCLAMLMIMAVAVPTMASTVMPRYTYVDSIMSRITANTFWGIVTCEGELIAKDNRPVKITVKLQQYNNGTWTTIKSWSATDNFSVYLSKSYAVARDYRYRAMVEGFVYDEDNYVVEMTSIADELYLN